MYYDVLFRLTPPKEQLESAKTCPVGRKCFSMHRLRHIQVWGSSFKRANLLDGGDHKLFSWPTFQGAQVNEIPSLASEIENFEIAHPCVIRDRVVRQTGSVSHDSKHK